MLTELHGADIHGSLERTSRRYVRADLLAIDDFAVLAMDPAQTTLAFQVIAKRLTERAETFALAGKGYKPNSPQTRPACPGRNPSAPLRRHRRGRCPTPVTRRRTARRSVSVPTGGRLAPGDTSGNRTHGARWRQPPAPRPPTVSWDQVRVHPITRLHAALLVR